LNFVAIPAAGFTWLILDKAQVIELGLIRQKIAGAATCLIRRKFCVDAIGMEPLSRVHQFETIRLRQRKPAIHHSHVQTRRKAREGTVFCRAPRRLSVRLISL
jgi:hypothetical protein